MVSKEEFRTQAAAMCLLLRKQRQGGQKFVKFLNATVSSDPITGLKIYGFKGYGHLDISYKAYVHNLSYDISVGRTPNMGLTWFVPKKIRSNSK